MYMHPDMTGIFGPQGLLAKKLPLFEDRPGQHEMAQAVSDTLTGTEGPLSSSRGHLLAVEAETGIGKTLAYLIPAALCGKKVVLSTGTIALQDQIITKEIPFIQKHIIPDLHALCVKGRENYLCLMRAKQLLLAPQPSLFEENPDIGRLQKWMGETETGDRSELSWLPDHSELWQQLNAPSRLCLGGNCPDWQECWITRLRKKAAKAQMLIVNHHLFFSDLGLRRFGHAEVLPRYEAVIFDEAHHLEGIATQYFGTSFSQYQILEIAKDIRNCAEGQKTTLKKEAMRTAKALAEHGEQFAALFPKELGRFPLQESTERITGWQQQLEVFLHALRQTACKLENWAKTSEIWEGIVKRQQELIHNLETVTTDQDPHSVYWYERRPKSVSLSATPIDIARTLQEQLYSETAATVFTSATLTTGGTFDYFFERMGLGQETETLTLSSPFNYKEHTRLFVPQTPFPEPNMPEYQDRLQQEALAILNSSQGRALFLFTSIRAMKAMRSFLDNTLSYPILMQGEAPKHQLLSTFQEETHSVLLAVASFWEGINVPGDSLSCVLIDKLPFEVPSDPVIMARIEKIKGEGGKPFFDFQVPRAILSLRQGIGRLMRAATDRGLIAIMDIRLFTKGYGKKFLKSLPESPIIRTVADIHTFFEGT